MQTVLIANRGEIALRVIRSCKKLGLKTVAVYSDPDRGAPHCIAADNAIALGGETTAESYLKIEKIITAAKQSGADAIHPGYGFLSENPIFVDAVQAAGFTFVGPSAAAMRALGHKHQAREVATAAGVPVIPGYQGSDQDLTTLINQAMAIGFPLMVKASAGGGGRGMRIVHDVSGLKEALESAAREAQSFFGDRRLILERAISKSRHIEVQVIADTQGNVIHLFERECSLQRRNQKVIEESPAPGLSSSMRQAMCAAAISIAKAGKLTNATTMEFLVPFDNPKEEFFFLEANCRIQVEHPVTEMVTGVDLVELQLRVARGEPLPLTQQQVAQRGHAVEARVYAEAPGLSFAPKSGRVSYLRLPPSSERVRIDHALALGVVVSTNYDPMLAKVIAWGETRADALTALDKTLAEFIVFGVDNNSAFLRSLLGNPTVHEGPVTTSFIAEHLEELTTVDRQSPLVVAAAWLLLRSGSGKSGLPLYWRAQTAATELPTAPREVSIRSSTNTISEHQTVEVIGAAADTVSLRLGGRTVVAQIAHRNSGCDGISEVTLDLDGSAHQLTAGWRSAAPTDDTPLHVLFAGHSYSVEQYIRRHAGSGESGEESDGAVLAPLPGTILSVAVQPGATVEDGTRLATIESMKMEHSINSPCKGLVAEVFVSSGSAVKESQLLFTITPEQ